MPLNSTMVRFIFQAVEGIQPVTLSLNSTMVRFISVTETLKLLKEAFKFHYGKIHMGFSQANSFFSSSLNSTMVRFICKAVMLTGSGANFKFHYGKIHIRGTFLTICSASIFKFHYGKIHIQCNIKRDTV